MRNDSRTAEQIRPIKITPHFTKHAAGSALIEIGSTVVLCNVSCEQSLPPFLRGQRNQGWLTAEYAMLPASTHSRVRRERQKVSGRSQEIQRLIGRTLRGIVDLKKMPEITLTVDCDVLQADGGTRTASITGANVALNLAVKKLLLERRLKSNPITHQVAAISCGIVEGEILVDLNYEEDSQADADMNIVLLEEGQLLEIQGTAEKEPFSADSVSKIITLAHEGLKPIFKLQRDALEGSPVES